MNGVLPSQQIKELIRTSAISSSVQIGPRQVQPSSLDLRLGTVAYRIRSSFLPQNSGVEKRLPDLQMYSINLERECILERGNVYLIPLMEELNLPGDVRGKTNPKSTTGRLDIFTRAITDNSHRFEDIAEGYRGKMYLEVVPRSFTVRVRAGISLNQIRLFRGEAKIGAEELVQIYREHHLLFDNRGNPIPLNRSKIGDGIFMGIEVRGVRKDGIIGFKAKKNSMVIDLEKKNRYRVSEFWEPIRSPKGNSLILEPEEFYIFASKERVRVPTPFAAEMVEYDAGSGELRTHYAGFFDSGFGYGSGKVRGTKAVLEVRPHDVPFRVEDGQTFFKMRYEPMAEIPETYYGKAIGSNYHNQSLRLGKQFQKRVSS